MPVNFSGGPSGMRQDYKAPTPSSGAAQPVLDTSTSGGTGDVYFQSENFEHKHPVIHATPTLPTGGTIPNSTDIEDPTATEGGWGPGVQTSKSTYSGPGTGR